MVIHDCICNIVIGKEEGETCEGRLGKEATPIAEVAHWHPLARPIYNYIYMI